MTVVRRLLRRWLPFEARLGVALVRRWVRDRRSGFDFAGGRADPGGFPCAVATYTRPFRDYPGQERLAAAKRRNQRVMAGLLEGALIEPGQVFSLWRYAGRPHERLGYQSAAALKEGRLTTDIGGATCLLATVVYNLGLLGAMEIVERRCHSVDSYGEDRYFELGRDAAIEFGFTDLRFRNPHAFPVLLHFLIDDRCITGGLLAPVAPSFRVDLEVSEREVVPHSRRLRRSRDLGPGEIRVVVEGLPGLRTHTVRVVRYADGSERRDALGESVHLPQAEVVEVGGGKASMS